MKAENQAPKHIVIANAVYDAADVAAHKTFDEFKAEADAQTKSNSTAHWGGWPADKRDENLRSVYDQAVDAIRPKPAKQDPPKGDNKQ